ncbi:MAG: type II toxin-antitoxin system VapC family toxin [Janthinobacterium lividum]
MAGYGSEAPFVAVLVGLVVEQAIVCILPLDGPAAITCADIVAHRRRAGRPIPHSDTQVAAIARSRGAVLATCNGWGFERRGIAVVNTWTDTGNG